MKRIIKTTLFFGFLLSHWFSSPVRAQSLSLSLYPPLLEVMIQPGKTITQVYKLTNGGETNLILESKIVPFKPADELGNVKLNSSPPANQSSLSWFSFQNANLDLGQKFLLKAGQTQEIVLKLKIPPKAPEDDYYQTLLFETLPQKLSSTQSAGQAQAKIGTNILLTVSQDSQPPKKAIIDEFRLVSALVHLGHLAIIDSFDRPSFLLQIKNPGRAFFKPLGRIITTGWFGQKYFLDLLPENVLVKSTRLIHCSSPTHPTAKATVSFRVQPCQLDQRFLLGPYQTQVKFGLDELSPKYTAKITFLALPLKLVFALIIIGVLVWLTRSKLGPLSSPLLPDRQ